MRSEKERNQDVFCFGFSCSDVSKMIYFLFRKERNGDINAVFRSTNPVSYTRLPSKYVWYIIMILIKCANGGNVCPIVINI